MNDIGVDWSLLAAETAEIGGKVLNDYFGHVDSSSIQAKKDNDWVSAADRASESAIIEFLSRKAPGHGIFSEEAGYLPPSKSGNQYCWIIDPLDGTTNFLRGFPIWAVSVGLEFRSDRNSKWGEIIAGAVAIPPTGELFRASKGGGAYRNNKKIHVGIGHDLRQSLLGTGFPFRVPHLLDQHLDIFNLILSKCADVRRPGAAAVDLCYAAMGIYDGFWEFDLFPWDVAAGSLIIAEAGGIVSGICGEDDFLTTGDILTANPRIYSELLDLISTSLSGLTLPRPIDKGPLRDWQKA